jgi:hypothetical protein
VVAPYSYVATPTDQISVPGYAAGAEITPEGFLYTGLGELVFAQSGRPWRSQWRTLEDDRLPIVTSGAQRDGLRSSVTAFAELVGHTPVAFVRVRLRNPGQRPREARWSIAVRWSGGALKPTGVRRFRYLRPATAAQPGAYLQLGDPFDPSARYRWHGRALVRGAHVLLVAPSPSSTRARTADARVKPDTEFGRRVYRRRLGAHGSATLDFQVPLEAVAPRTRAARAIARTRFDTAHRRARARWLALLDRAAGIEIPEAKVRDAWYASLANILMPRYRTAAGAWVQAVNDLQYHAFWLRDAAVMTQALDLAGLTRQAGENLGFFFDWQRPDGLFVSRENQYDGFGQALWAIGQHVRRTGDDALARRALDPVARAMQWLAAARSADPLGLLPPSDPRDNEMIAGHLAGDDFWALDGIAEGVALARRLGREDLATSWEAQGADLRAALLRRLPPAAPIPPALDAPGGQDWGNLWAAYPAQVLSADDPRVAATMAKARAGFREGIATYLDGTDLHGYLGFRVFETDLLRGDQRAVIDGLYASLAHTTSTQGGFETGIRVFGKRSVDDNMTPHGWFAAEYVALLRNMLVREDDHGLTVFSALSPQWLRPGRVVAITHAPTLYGKVSVRLRSLRDGAVLTWSGVHAPLRWPVPAWVSAVRAPGLAAGARTIALTGSRGRLRVHWRLGATRLSFARTVAQLRTAYAARGLQPPS